MTVHNATQQQIFDAIDRVAKRFGYDAQSITQAKELVHAGNAVIVDENDGVIMCAVPEETADEDSDQRLWKSRIHSHQNRGPASHAPVSET